MNPLRPAILLAAIAGAIPLAAEAQSVRTVRGTVVRRAGLEPIAGARVFLVTEPAGLAATTSSSGAFSLRVPRREVRLVAARLGFAPDTVTLFASDSLVMFSLRDAALELSPAVVRADRSVSAASSAALRDLDIRLRPRESSQELLRLVPGLVIAQHAGGGKAEQIFLRGFDADHGTDVAISVDGMPVNMVTHAHGQGYADLHFLIPEIVERLNVRKGPYEAVDGDFATAGAVALETKDRIDGPMTSVRAGSFGTMRALLLAPFGGGVSGPGGYVGVAAHRADGPFLAPQNHDRLNLAAKLTAPIGQSAELFSSASLFSSGWNGSGQIPERAVATGVIDRFGAIDPTEGGSTGRADLLVGARSMLGATRWDARLFATRYRFRLFSNFTFLRNDSVNGDGIEQRDVRSVVGGQASVVRPQEILGREGVVRVGAGVRHDAGDVGLFRARDRQRFATQVSARSTQSHFFTWAQQTLVIGDRTRLEFGVRGDAFRFDIADHTPLGETTLARASGTRWHGVVSPKASLSVELTPSTTVFANSGFGFHSNDGRDVVLARDDERVLPRARGAEIGARRSWNGGSFAAALWALDLESELVYVGDEGTTEAGGRTRRVGADLEGRARLLPVVWADADVNLSRGRYRDARPGEDRIPLAPRFTATAGLTLRDAGPAEGGLRARVVGSRPADEAGAVMALGSTVWEAFGAWQLRSARVVVAVDNLFNIRWNEAQFATTSRLRGERAPVTELHFTPGAPRGVQAAVEFRF